jgi:prepilin-type N-terminal cleavage/methylation domain-containing protein/prepilin-type processing-associated H-X9-DG protein
MKTPPLSPPARATNTAFTLVELLVVIAIIGILAGILIPVTISARAVARAAQCKGNLRQIGIATQTFLTENKNVFYPHGGSGWYRYLNPYLNNRKIVAGLGARDYMLTCPVAVPKDGKNNYTGYSKNAWLGSVSSQDLSVTAAQLAAGLTCRQINDAYPASRVVVFWDDEHPDQYGDGGWPGNGFDADGVYHKIDGSWYKLSFRHKETCNILLLDGHVAALKPGPIRSGLDYMDYLWGFFPKYGIARAPSL